MTGRRVLTIDELWEEAGAAFGTNSLKWAFACPSCKDVATGDDFLQALADHPRKTSVGSPVRYSDILGQECIGRTLGALSKGYNGRGCNRAAYGLIPAPWEITLPSGRTVHSFPLAATPAPTAGAGGGDDA